ncbi:TAXI family TRAP transporter solute-binding subunit [Nonomuraea sp. NPDC050328]|uniref:TAXI family TRAP transporter solute-binding subunit n=1 Tax=Nonomuraea sp. NPDC050328 TaxID=3364361 RepID=UPI0037A107C1
MKILSPGGNWMTVAGELALGLAELLPPGATVATVTGHAPAGLAWQGPRLVAEGRYELAITTPAWHLTLQDLPLACLAAFPHDDQLAFAVRKELGIDSLSQVKGLKVSMPGPGHPTHWAVERVLSQYGVAIDDLELLRDRPASLHASDLPPVDPGFDAVFDEALMTMRWKNLTQQYDLTFLPLDADVLDTCRDMGMTPGVLRAGRLRGVERDVPTVDFSGWYLYCARDLPDELAYAAVRALDERKEAISARFPMPLPPLTGPIDLPGDTPLPLHPGARAYYAEKGYL